MAQRFGMVESHLWTDEVGGDEFLTLGTDARLLFLWSFTHRDAAICGLYTASLRTMARALAPAPSGDRDAWRELEDRVFAALAELGRKPMVLYDDEAEVVWVVNRARRAADRGSKTLKGMANEFAACPPSPLRDRFAQTYGRMLNIETGGRT